MAEGRRGALLLVSGSTRKGSVNTAVLTTAAMLLPSAWDASFSPGVAQLPIFDPDLEESSLPPSVARLRSSIQESDALLFCTPEYAGAMPGGLKNLLEWTIGDTVMSGKPVGWINPSTGPRRAAGTYAALRTVLSYAQAAVVEDACREVPVSRAQIDSGMIDDPKVRSQLSDALLALTGSISV